MTDFMNSQGIESGQVTNLIFDELKEAQDNDKCADCGNVDPKWASVNNAVFICLNCASTHRALGLHISCVRSLTLDSWNETQLKSMSVGGNQKFKEFMAQYDLDEETIKNKYQSQAAEYYRKKVKACANQEQFDEPVLGYYEGRELVGASVPSYPDVNSIPAPPENDYEEVKSEFAMDSDGNVVKEEVPPVQASAEDKKRAAKLMHEFFQTTIQVGNKGVEILSFAGSKLEAKIDENEKAKKYKDTGKKYAKKGAEYANVGLNYAVDAGRYVGKKAYNYAQTEEFKSGWKKTVDGTKSAAKAVGSYISEFFKSELNNEYAENQDGGNNSEPKPYSDNDASSTVPTKSNK